MSRDIFGEVARPRKRLGSQSRYTLPVSIAAHVVIAALVVLVPLMASDVLPAPRTVIGVFAAQPAPPPPPPPPAGAPARSSRPAAVAATSAPSTAPDSIEPEPVTTATVIGDAALVPGGLPDGAIGGISHVPGPPEIPAPPPPSGPLPIGGRIKEPTKIRHVPPAYPRIAQDSRVEGTVVIEAVIGIDGRVKEARVVVSKPLLDAAALEAVRQWVFSPTLLNGMPVPVIMTVTVNFKLN